MTPIPNFLIRLVCPTPEFPQAIGPRLELEVHWFLGYGSNAGNFKSQKGDCPVSAPKISFQSYCRP